MTRQLLPRQTATVRTRDRVTHTGQVRLLAEVVRERPFRDVAVEVFSVNVNLGSLERTLQNRPEVLNTVRVHVTRDVLVRGVVHRLVGVVRVDTLVGVGLVAVDVRDFANRKRPLR